MPGVLLDEVRRDAKTKAKNIAFNIPDLKDCK